MAVTSQSTLKELVDETTVIKDELVNCRNNLKTNLSNKGVDTTSLNKMQDLVNSIPKLKVLPSVMRKGDTWAMYDGYENTTTGYEWKRAQSYYFQLPGSCRCVVKFKLQRSNGTGLEGNIRVNYIKDGSVIVSKEERTYSENFTELIIEFDDVKIGDRVEIFTKNNDHISFTNYLIFKLQIKCALTYSDFI